MASNWSGDYACLGSGGKIECAAIIPGLGGLFGERLSFALGCQRPEVLAGQPSSGGVCELGGHLGCCRRRHVPAGRQFRRIAWQHR